MNNGFYKLDGEDFIYAANNVYHKDFELLRDNYQNNIYPIDGWYWFDSLLDACNFFDLDYTKYISDEELDMYNNTMSDSIKILLHKYLLGDTLSTEDLSTLLLVYDSYVVDKLYRTDDVFRYQNELYIVLENHTSQLELLPNMELNLYKKI